MGIFNSIIAIALCAFMIWMLVRTIRHRPELFSKQALNKSFFSMGLLALALIVVVGIVALLLRA